jgi:hypothetical protein
VKARLVVERNDAFDMQSGPYGYERIGFAIGERVFWTGCTGSGMPGGTYDADRALAELIIARFNRHWEGKCGECSTNQALGHPTQYETSCESCIKKFNEAKWGPGR